MPHRYFTTQIEGVRAALSGPDAHHLAHVMRARLGDTVLLCDGQGTDYTAQVSAFAPDRVEFELLGQAPCPAEPGLAVTLFAGYPKQDKLETIVQKAVELGAVAVTPFFSRFCVAAPKKEEQKNARYARIAAEAAKQCGRGILPQVGMPLTFAQLCGALPAYDAALLCYEGGGAPLRALAARLPRGARVALITGAEGGFAPDEARALQQAGAAAIGLGPRILRCETAPLAALAALMAFTGNLE